ncbi:four helix bundle protein [Candidatus Uhrbacteria bacterium]|nr:four helix bundle protein [Candidatus Uhrbacteria bacterium]MBD3284019.1 four helix bundle protein [Candidatus Uhrbacteria bacterium]
MSDQRLIVWQYAADLAVEMMPFTKLLPLERYGLSAQMRRAAVSIASNIAEGYPRKRGSEDHRQFMRIALGSTSELETQVIIAKRTGFIRDTDAEKVESLLDHVQRLLGCVRFR